MTHYQVRMHSGELKHVIAETGADALHFLGVRDGSASVHPVSYDVEVIGLHPAHEPLAPCPITKVPSQFGATRFVAFSDGRGNNFDTRTAAGFRAEDYAADCAEGTCDCAPTCGLCGKGKMYDNKRMPGYHDWTCPHCIASGYQPWKLSEVVQDAVQ